MVREWLSGRPRLLMLKLTKPIRALLKKPFGEVLKGSDVLARVKGRRIIAVGDSTLEFLLSNAVKPDVAVYDFRCMRKEISKEARERIRQGLAGMSGARVKNPAGEITDAMREAVVRAVASGGAVFVDGEEDLAALVAMAVAGDGELILYGQPEKGVVLIECSGKMREKALEIIGKMETG